MDEPQVIEVNLLVVDNHIENFLPLEVNDDPSIDQELNLVDELKPQNLHVGFVTFYDTSLGDLVLLSRQNLALGSSSVTSGLWKQFLSPTSQTAPTCVVPVAWVNVFQHSCSHPSTLIVLMDCWLQMCCLLSRSVERGGFYCSKFLSK